MKNRLLRTSMLILVLAVCLSVFSMAADISYNDTDGHWAENAITRWTGYGVVAGDGVSFSPDAPLTRAMMATIISNTLKLTEEAKNSFADINDGDWYATYILRCNKAGIILGDGKNANPNALLTREEAMVMLCRALNIPTEKDIDLSSFKDSDKVSDWATPYVAALTKAGIVGGVAEGVLSPKGDMSRAAMVTVLDRTIVQYINEPGTHKLTDKDGIIIVATNSVTLTGKTSADLLVTPAANNSRVTINNATITGNVTIQSNNTSVNVSNSTVPKADLTGSGTRVNTDNANTNTNTNTNVSTGTHTHQYGDWAYMNPTTHKKVCVYNSSHIMTAPHNWNSGTVTVEPTLESEGEKLYICLQCFGQKTEILNKLEPEGELMGKNGYDIEFEVTNNILSFMPTFPESDSAPRHSVNFISSADPNAVWSYNSEFLTSIDAMVPFYTFDKVTIKTHESFDDEGVKVAEWKLDKKIISTGDAFEISSDGITLTKTKPDASENSVYTFTGLDTENYAFTIDNRMMRRYVTNEPFTSACNGLDYENGAVQLYARTVEETEDSYIVKCSKLVEIIATEVEGDDENEDEQQPNQAPLGYELTQNEHDTLYVSVKTPETTTGIRVYKVKIYDGDELLLEADADISEPKAVIDPRLLKGGDLTVKITAMGDNGELGTYTGTLAVELTFDEIEIDAKYEDEIFSIELPSDYVGTAKPLFNTEISDTEGTEIISYFFGINDTYKFIRFSKEQLDSSIVSALEGDGGFVKFTGWTLTALENNTEKSILTVTVSQSQSTAITVVEEDTVDYSALGVTVETQGVYYKFIITNPENTSNIAKYRFNIYDSNNPTNKAQPRDCTPADPTAWVVATFLDPNVAYDTIEVVSYDIENNAIGTYTCGVTVVQNTQSITYTPVYDRSTGLLTVTFSEAITAFFHRTYKADLDSNETDLTYESVENSAKTYWDKQFAPLANIIDQVEANGGYIQLDGWNSNSIAAGDSSITINFTVYDGEYTAITVTGESSGSGEGGSGEDGSGESSLPTDPD